MNSSLWSPANWRGVARERSRRQTVTARGVFVTGTDTGVGKTVVACELVRRLQARGIETGVLKPIETGVGVAGPADAIALQNACGQRDPIADVCPQQFALATAPSVAAAAENRRVDLTAIGAAFDRVCRGCDFVVVEGAGGLLVPINDDFDMLDLARHLGLPALLVARAALGTINHTLLTLEALRTRKIDIAGVILNGPRDRENRRAIEEYGQVEVVGEIEPIRPLTRAGVRKAARRFDRRAKLRKYFE